MRRTKTWHELWILTPLKKPLLPVANKSFNSSFSKEIENKKKTLGKYFQQHNLKDPSLASLPPQNVQKVSQGSTDNFQNTPNIIRKHNQKSDQLHSPTNESTIRPSLIVCSFIPAVFQKQPDEFSFFNSRDKQPGHTYCMQFNSGCSHWIRGARDVVFALIYSRLILMIKMSIDYDGQLDSQSRTIGSHHTLFHWLRR